MCGPAGVVRVKSHLGSLNDWLVPITGQVAVVVVVDGGGGGGVMICSAGASDLYSTPVSVYSCCLHVV